MNKLNLFSYNSPYLDANIPEEKDTASLYKTAIQGNHIARGILMGWSALDLAVEMRNGPILDSLLRRNSNPDATLLNSERKSPVVRAVEEWDVQTVEVLLKAAPIDTKNNEESFQILEAAIRANAPPQMLDLLLKNGATPTNNSCYPPVSLLPKCMLGSHFECLLNANALQNMLTELKTEEDRRVFVDQLNQLVDSNHPYWKKRLNEELMNVGLGSDVAADEEVASINSSWLSTTPKKKYERYIIREAVVDRCNLPPDRRELRILTYIPFRDPDDICLGINADLITRFLLLNKKTQLVENLSKIFKFDKRAKEIQDYAKKIKEKITFPLVYPEDPEPYREMAAEFELFADLDLVAKPVPGIIVNRICKEIPPGLKECIQKYQDCPYYIAIKTKTPDKSHAISLFQGEDSDCIFDSHFGLFIVDKKATAKLLWHVICNHYNNEVFTLQFIPLSLFSGSKSSMRQKTVSVITGQSSKTDAITANAQIIGSLIIAISLKDEKKVEELLAQNPDLNDWNKTGYTPLAITAHYGDAKTAEKLLNTPNIDVNLPNKNSNLTPLMIAIQMGHVEVLKVFLSHGATKTEALEYAQFILKELEKQEQSDPEEIIRLKTMVALLTKQNSMGRYELLSQALERGLKALSSLPLYDIPEQSEGNESTTTTSSQAGAGAGRGP